MNTVIRIIKHAESYEVRTSRFFYFRWQSGPAIDQQPHVA